MRNVTVCKCKRCGKLLYWDGKKFLDYANLDVVFRAYKMVESVKFSKITYSRTRVAMGKPEFAWAFTKLERKVRRNELLLHHRTLLLHGHQAVLRW